MSQTSHLRAKLVLALGGVIICIATVIIGLSQNIFAYTTYNALNGRVGAFDINRCYFAGGGNDAVFPNSVNAFDFSTSGGILKTSSIGTSKVPIINKNNASSIECADFINAFRKPPASSASAATIQHYFTDLGYTKTDNFTHDGLGCFTVTIDGKKSNEICIPLDASGNMDMTYATIGSPTGANNPYVMKGGDGTTFAVSYKGTETQFNDSVGICNTNALPTWAEFKERCLQSNELKDYLSGVWGLTNGASINAVNKDSEMFRVYTMQDRAAASVKFLNDHSNFKDFTEMLFGDYQKHSLYKYYLLTYWGFSMDSSTCNKTQGSYKIPFGSATDPTYCGLLTKNGTPIDDTSVDLSTYSTVNGMDHEMVGSAQINVRQAIDAINAISYGSGSAIAGSTECTADPDTCLGAASMQDEEEDGGGDDGDESDDGDDTELKEWTLADCYKVAGVAGWVVCPVLSFMREVLTRFYDGMIVPYMQINPSLLSYSESSPTYRAWASFRDIANVIFVILLLIIIFSQVTGFGIDNYGVKRTLPKLIIGAILVNISFFLCQLAADLSNLAGGSIQNMLTSLSSYSGNTAEFLGGGAGDLMGGIVGTLLSISAFGGLVWGGFQTGIIPGGWVFLMPILLAFASGIISLIFLLVLLGARQAAIVALTVFSPLALVFYALPNTNSIAKRWLKMFEGLLLLYPICGAMVGAGRLTAGIILSLSETGFWTNIMAFLLTVIPFFFIPTLLRKSMSAIGDIGSRISSVGARFSGRATGALGNAVRGSASYQAQMNRASQLRSTRLREREGRNAQNTMRRLDRIRAQNGGLNARQQRQYQQAQVSAYKASRAEQAEAAQARSYARNQEMVDNPYSPGGAQISRQQLLDYQEEEANVMKEAYSQYQNMTDVEQQAELERLLTTAPANYGTNESARIKTLVDSMSVTEEGRQAIGEAVHQAERSGNANQSAMTTYARQVMNNHAKDFKDNSRDIFNHAAQHQSTGTGDSMEHHRQNVNVEGLTQTQMRDMDDNTFNNIKNNLESRAAAPSATADDKKNLETFQRLAYEAVNDPNNKGKLKPKRETMLNDATQGYIPQSVLNEAYAENERFNAEKAQQITIEHEKQQDRDERAAVNYGRHEFEVADGSRQQLYNIPVGYTTTGKARQDPTRNGHYVVEMKDAKGNTRKWDASTGQHIKE